MVVFRKDPCGFTCLLMTYAAVLYADYVVIRWIGKIYALKTYNQFILNTGCRLQLVPDRIFTPVVEQFHEIFVKKIRKLIFVIFFRINKNFVRSEFKKSSQYTGSNITPINFYFVLSLYSIIYDARFLLGIISYHGFQHHCHNVIHGTLQSSFFRSWNCAFTL